MKQRLRAALREPTPVIGAIVGASLLAIALHFGVNPVDGSVVDASIRETWIPVALFFTTLPAMALMFLTGGGTISSLLMYLAQIATYWTIGRLVSRLVFSLSKAGQPPP